MSTNYSEYNGKAPRYIGADGTVQRGDDAWWEQTRRDYEVAGVPDDLVLTARPLLDGTPTQQRLAHDFLMGEAGTWTANAKAHVQLHALLRDQDMPIADREGHTEDEFIDAWDEFSGKPSGPNQSRYSLGTSDEAARSITAGLARETSPGE